MEEEIGINKRNTREAATACLCLWPVGIRHVKDAYRHLVNRFQNIDWCSRDTLIFNPAPLCGASTEVNKVL